MVEVAKIPSTPPKTRSSIPRSNTDTLQDEFVGGLRTPTPSVKHIPDTRFCCHSSSFDEGALSVRSILTQTHQVYPSAGLPPGQRCFTKEVHPKLWEAPELRSCRPHLSTEVIKKTKTSIPTINPMVQVFKTCHISIQDWGSRRLWRLEPRHKKIYFAKMCYLYRRTRLHGIVCIRFSAYNTSSPRGSSGTWCQPYLSRPLSYRT